MQNENKNRKSIRIKEYGYSEPGDYFITICIQNRENLFGEIVDDKMVLNEAGRIVKEEILNIPKRFKNVALVVALAQARITGQELARKCKIHPVTV